MAQTNTLNATRRRRSGTGALKQMRREGLIPACLYGKTQENENIKVDAREFSALLNQSVSEHILVDLDIEGTVKLALIQQVQHDPLSGAILHADFHAVSATETIHSLVPVEITGDAPGAKAGGVLDVMIHEIDVTCLPKDLPEKIQVDVSALELGDAFQISDLKLPSGVSATGDPSLVLAIVHHARVADAEAAEGGPAEPEVMREKKPAD